ncbi:TetR/AcrR family transcriptional regulator [Amycolatopsis rhizosphaerae]|uniref:TetR/AcrR family transcriptional regulator n=1 Tax=Amycolatopsis rhizosphaerae TaxID=2053003 RepID=A0A558C0K7_9PSEU|nr:TetR/AcrR family transcriptional regulator C-terminal domain-containing protein [Amycolatopsis rhizosphaerae]TVT42300.1 TetR/AcrR family transcriptional regulator [Amycolatopsis rhizosphaerae]
MPRPRSLTQAQLATAALAVLDRDGLEGLSMRMVAKELGVGTMSLYRYVADRDQLEGAIVDQVLRAVPLDLPPGTSARERLVLFAERIRKAVGEHPAAVPLLLARRHASPAARQWGEAVLGVLADAGFSRRESALTFRAYLSYVLGALQTDHFSPLSGPGTVALGELPEADFPFLAGAAREARHISPHEEFHHGLELLLRGLGLP